MRLEVLLATMNCGDFSLLDRMNVTTDALIGNQCSENRVDSVVRNNKAATMYSFAEKGVGLNRNNLLMRTNADICLFSDDDILYDNGYEAIILDEYRKHPEADIIVFNLRGGNEIWQPYKVKKYMRLHRYNCMRYMTPRISARVQSVHGANIFFSLLFGGGAKYCAGEDCLFLYEAIKKGLRVYASEKYIGEASFDSSSWFNGFDERYFTSKGAFFYAVSRHIPHTLCLQLLIRHREMLSGKIGFSKAYKLMCKGIQEMKIPPADNTGNNE